MKIHGEASDTLQFLFMADERNESQFVGEDRVV